MLTGETLGKQSPLNSERLSGSKMFKWKPTSVLSGKNCLRTHSSTQSPDNYSLHILEPNKKKWASNISAKEQQPMTNNNNTKITLQHAHTHTQERHNTNTQTHRHRITSRYSLSTRSGTHAHTHKDDFYHG